MRYTVKNIMEYLQYRLSNKTAQEEVIVKQLKEEGEMKFLLKDIYSIAVKEVLNYCKSRLRTKDKLVFKKVLASPAKQARLLMELREKEHKKYQAISHNRNVLYVDNED
jgi:hypothetical protein